MKYRDFLIALEEEYINEGIVNEAVKKMAAAFFKKHPDLLKQATKYIANAFLGKVKIPKINSNDIKELEIAYGNSSKVLEDLNEGKIKNKFLGVIAALAIMGGMISGCTMASPISATEIEAAVKEPTEEEKIIGTWFLYLGEWKISFAFNEDKTLI
jgi:hypothetical protein